MPQTFAIDPAHTRVSFTFDHFGFSNPLVQHEQIEGALVVDQADWGSSSVNMTAQLVGLHTDTQKFDEHFEFDSAKKESGAAEGHEVLAVEASDCLRSSKYFTSVVVRAVRMLAHGGGEACTTRSALCVQSVGVLRGIRPCLQCWTF